jgi:hypothetical protein
MDAFWHSALECGFNSLLFHRDWNNFLYKRICQNFSLEDRRARTIHLPRQQSRGKFYYRSFQAQPPQAISGLKTQKPATDDHAFFDCFRGGDICMFGRGPPEVAFGISNSFDIRSFSTISRWASLRRLPMTSLQPFFKHFRQDR